MQLAVLTLEMDRDGANADAVHVVHASIHHQPMPERRHALGRIEVGRGEEREPK